MIRDTFFKLCASVRARSFSSLVFWCTCVYVCVCVCACVCVCVWSSVRVFLSNGVRAVCGRMKGRGGGGAGDIQTVGISRLKRSIFKYT